MNGYDQYTPGGAQDGGNNTPPDFYDVYTDLQVKSAKGVFSRFHLGLFIYTVASYVILNAIALILALTMGEEAYTALVNDPYFNILMGVGPAYIVGFPLFLIITKGMKTRKYEKRRMSLGEFLMIFAVAEAAMTLGNYIGVMLNGVIGTILGHDIENSTADLISRTPVWLLFIVVVVIGPIIEEFIFRKLMIDRLGRYGSLLAITVSAVSFGLFHGNFYQFFYATLLGFVLGYVYVKTGTLLYSTLLHMLINFLGSIVALPVSEAMETVLEIQEQILAGGEYDFQKYFKAMMLASSYEIFILAVVIAGIVIFVNAVRNRKIQLDKRCEYILPRERTVSTVMGNTGSVLYLIASLLLFAASIFMV